MVETDFQATLDLLDALEAALAARAATLPSSNGRAGDSGPLAPAGSLNREMERIALTSAEFSAVFNVSATLVEEWLSGASAAPAWAWASVRLLCMLPPAVRRKLLGRPEPVNSLPPHRRHPFSRIEEL